MLICLQGMIESFFERVLQSYHRRFVSRRLILAIDACIVAFSFLLAVILRFNFELSDINWALYRYYLLTIVGVRVVFFLYLRSYHGIVRHTSLEDMQLIFKTILLSSLTVAVVSIGIAQLNQDHRLYIPVSVLAIDFFICLFILIGSRFFVKSIYTDISKAARRRTTQPTLIYGAGSMGILTKNILAREQGVRHEVVGFIDDNPSLHNKSVEGTRVHSPEAAFTKYIDQAPEVPEVILAINQLPTARKKAILEFFLQHDIVVKVVPSTHEWLNGQLSTEQIRKIRIEDLLVREPIQLNNETIAHEIQGKIVLVTGAAGSIGRVLAQQLARYTPSCLLLLDQAESGLYELDLELKHLLGPTNTPLIVPIVASITDPIRIQEIFQTYAPQFVYHAAAYKHVPLMEQYPYEAIRVNTLGTQIVADAAHKHCAEVFVFISTDKAVNPTNVMGATKRAAEMYVKGINKHSDTKFITTRFGNVLGSNGSVVPLFKRQIQQGGPITVTHPDVIRYFMTIPEACELVLEASCFGKGGEVFVFDMGEPVKIVDLARRMIKLSGLKEGHDINISFTGLRPGEKLYEELLTDKEKSQPTHHPKIMIARLESASFEHIQAQLHLLEEVLQKENDRERMVILLKELVPEFVSNNSEFEKLDYTHEKPTLGQLI